jgi:hypothetical protein
MGKYFYYATGENVESIKFESNTDAWSYVESHNGYDCVVESREV